MEGGGEMKKQKRKQVILNQLIDRISGSGSKICIRLRTLQYNYRSSNIIYYLMVMVPLLNII